MIVSPYAIVLTGGIASGKSTVGTLLKLQGFTIIDADVIAHEELDKSCEDIRKVFGDEFIKDAKPNRKALGKLIFTCKASKEKLENILHPKIRMRILKECERMDKFKVPYIVDIPLYFEKEDIYKSERVVVVYTPQKTQLYRLCEREGFESEEAIQRINSQLDIEEKRKKADIIIDNSKDLKHLQDEVDKCAKKLKELYAGIKV